MTKNQKKYLNYLIKFVIVGLAMWFVYTKVSNQKNLQTFKSLVADINSTTICMTIGIVIVMMFANWLLEVKKWQFIIKDIESISFGKALKSVFCGLTWAIFTPNRVGEYGGRVMLLQSENRGKGAVLMGVGLFAQLVLTSFFGSLSIAWFITQFIDAPTSVIFAVWLIAVIYAFVFVLLYFNVHWIDYLVSKIRFLKRVKPFFGVLEEVSVRQLWVILLYALCRFVIFSSQYILLMVVILPGLPTVSMILMIFILFFVQAAVPSLDIFDFSVRSFVASNLYSYITTQQLAVMAIVSFIWFVNLILPAIIGSFFVMNVNYLSDRDS